MPKGVLITYVLRGRETGGFLFDGGDGALGE